MMPNDPLERVRRLCLALPDVSERLSHGEPTFFVHGKVFVMFSNNHHSDGHIAAIVPVPTGIQAALIEQRPAIFYYPAYVGVRGWVGIELGRINDEDLGFYVRFACELIAL